MPWSLFLKAGPWLALGIAAVVLWGLLGRLDAAETKLHAANAVIEQREQDAKENAKAVAQLAEKLATTESKVVTVTERIYSAPKTTACPEQPAIRAAIDGVRDIYASGVQASGGRQPSGAVQGPGPAGRDANR